ncbi:MAG: PQQ-binding-like beta-propeller repeat protein, partial [Verrucomicrobiota bacterium]
FLILGLAAVFLLGVRRYPDLPFQQRNLASLSGILAAAGLLVLWWLFLSRARWRLRLGVLALLLVALAGLRAGFRITGVSGDLLPIIEPRWGRRAAPAASGPGSAVAPQPPRAGPASERPPGADFPQFLGPSRNGILPDARLDTQWAARPPAEVWRMAIGGAWSGFAVAGNRALTQEQQGDEERVTCRDLPTGRLLWERANPGRYDTTIAGAGPRCTPTVAGDRVYTLGATGWLQCLDLATGSPLWTRSITNDARARVPEWGYSGSPWARAGLVVVMPGGRDGRSVIAYDAATGTERWAAGDAGANYGSPFSLTLAGVEQILVFGGREIVSHDVLRGTILWRRPWGVGMPLVAVPVPVDDRRVLFSAGYNVGSELLRIDRGPEGGWKVGSEWVSRRLKCKFANPVKVGGFVYGLDDGILACLDLRDGSQRWKEGRYGHGQGLQVGELHLLMAESGELVLLRPTPEGPNELARHRVFASKTWNPPALCGDLLLVRNDREAACLRLPVRP